VTVVALVGSQAHAHSALLERASIEVRQIQWLALVPRDWRLDRQAA
jgi:hypothetical protein